MFGSIGWTEILIIMTLGVLLFGRRLPEVGRSLGKTFVEFKKGVRGLEDEMDTSATPSKPAELPADSARPPQRVTASAPKFEDAPANSAPKF